MEYYLVLLPDFQKAILWLFSSLIVEFQSASFTLEMEVGAYNLYSSLFLMIWHLFWVSAILFNSTAFELYTSVELKVPEFWRKPRFEKRAIINFSSQTMTYNSYYFHDADKPNSFLYNSKFTGISRFLWMHHNKSHYMFCQLSTKYGLAAVGIVCFALAVTDSSDTAVWE